MEYVHWQHCYIKYVVVDCWLAFSLCNLPMLAFNFVQFQVCTVHELILDDRCLLRVCEQPTHSWCCLLSCALQTRPGWACPFAQTHWGSHWRAKRGDQRPLARGRYTSRACLSRCRGPRLAALDWPACSLVHWLPGRWCSQWTPVILPPTSTYAHTYTP